MKLLKNKLAVVVIILSVTFLGLIGYSAHKENMSFAKNGIGVTLNSIQGLVYKASNKLHSSFSFFANFSDVKKENDELKKENIELQDKAIEYNSLKRENEELRKMLNFRNQRSEFNYVGCDIIGISGDSFLSGFTLNRGSKDGIKKEMIAITSAGLVGQVTSVGENWCIVQSLANENIAVAGFVESTKESNGIVKGYKDSENKLLAQIQRLSLDSKIKVGDVILTSGLGPYPKGIKIGYVLSVHENRGEVMKSAIIQPYVDFNKLEEVFILVSKENREIKE